MAKLHVAGGEIRSSGTEAGFSFSDRFDTGAAWQWYAASGAARLAPKGPGADALTIHDFGSKTDYFVEINGSLITTVQELRGVMPEAGAQIPTLRCRATALAVEDPAAPLAVPGLPTQLASVQPNPIQAPPPPPIPEPTTPVPPRIALFHDFINGRKDGLVINHLGRYTDGVKIEGNVQVTGALTQASSIALKENVTALSGQEAMAVLQGLNAVKFNYRVDSQKEQHVGFIAEEVPDLVTSGGRDRLSLMDLIAVLTKAVQELAVEVSALKARRGGGQL
jgi:hypothetical protein